jgi:hypothetical protein
MALFSCCNGLVGRVRPAPCDVHRPACPRVPATGPRTNGGGLWWLMWAGAWSAEPLRERGGVHAAHTGLAVRAHNLTPSAQVPAGALFAHPPPALDTRCPSVGVRCRCCSKHY